MDYITQDSFAFAFAFGFHLKQAKERLQQNNKRWKETGVGLCILPCPPTPPHTFDSGCVPLFSNTATRRYILIPSYRSLQVPITLSFLLETLGLGEIKASSCF